MSPTPTSKSPSRQKLTVTEIYAAIFGLFLGLAIWKFGNPVILDRIILPPTSLHNLWYDAWPLHWANVLFVAITVLGAVLMFANPFRWPATRWLWILPLVWLAWQFLSAAQSQYHDLTTPTLWQYAGCVICFFLGALVIGQRRGWRLVLLGLLAAFAFCLVRAVNQKLFEFPSERQFLIESEHAGFTNMPPSMFLELKQNNIIIHTNGVDVANPAIIAKYEKGRVSGTLFYPNALAGLVLMLVPIALVIVWHLTRPMRPLVCYPAMGLTIFLGLSGLFWSGSKSGWLIALAIGVVWLLRLKWSRQLKWVVVIAILAGGLVLFGLRFQNYFAKGATSVGARFDYWRVAARVTADHPAFGTGPGTFQRPYAQMKRPESEMARLVHNDYLEQFSDSGFVGGITYAAWLGLLLGTLGRRIWSVAGWLEFGIFAGLLGWFCQGLIEFSLFVPALAWTAFTLAGCLLARSANQVDKPNSPV
jgi:O-antigen ligase